MFELYLVFTVFALGIGAVVVNYLTRKPAPYADQLFLTRKEYVAYSLLFLLIPYACVLVSSTLFYAWRQQHPRKARQINKLGFIVFGVQLLMMCAYNLLMLALGGGQ